MNVLRSLKNVDADRIAYVGHDFGAMYGTLAASEEKNLKAFVFMAGTPRFADWFLFGRKLDEIDKQAVYEKLSPIDPIRHIGKIAPIPLLLQFGTGDFYVPDDRIQALFDAAGAPKKMSMYQGEHGLDEHARTERVLWLAQYLGIAIHEDWFLRPSSDDK
jgi:dienelactone hydrolase